MFNAECEAPELDLFLACRPFHDEHVESDKTKVSLGLPLRVRVKEALNHAETRRSRRFAVESHAAQPRVAGVDLHVTLRPG